MNISITEYLRQNRAIFAAEASRFISDQKEKYKDLSPEFNELLSHLETYLLTGGKWHRSTLGLLSYRLAGGTGFKQIVRGLTALEIMHRYILIHDDIIDRDLMRHGIPTIEKIYQDQFASRFAHKSDEMYSKGTALVSGDVVNALVFELLGSSKLPSEMIVAIMRTFNQLMIETVAGWQLQTEQNFQNIAEVTKEAFMKGMILVSAQYSVVWPLRIGQLLAGRLTSNAWDTSVEAYGLNAGIAFQMTDDLLGMFGDEKTTGKPSGHDFREGKKTFLLLHAYAQANQVDKAFLSETLGTDITPQQLERVRQIMKDTGAVAYVKEQATTYALSARQAIKTVKTADVEAVELLIELADLLADRDH